MTEDDLHGNRKYFWVNTEYGWTMKHLDQAGWWVDDMPSDEPQEGEEVVLVPTPARIEELEAMVMLFAYCEDSETRAKLREELNVPPRFAAPTQGETP